MKRLSILLIILVVLLLGYFGLRSRGEQKTFESPAAFQTSRWNTDQVDELRFTFAGGKQLILQNEAGKWLVDGFPADPGRVEQFFEQLGQASISSRASTNSQNHGRFEVDAKGVTLALVKQNEVIQDMVIGKTAGGDTVYVRLPDQDDVYVLSGLQRYLIADTTAAWRDNTIADFSADKIRRLQYVQNKNQWDLLRTPDGFTLAAPRLAPLTVDKEKTSGYLTSVAGLAAPDFPTKEEQEAAVAKPAYAIVTFELGTVEAFERKVVWTVYEVQGRYLVVRDSDKIGFYVEASSFSDVFGDYNQVKGKVAA
ncbi:MAG: DUF4340 domain-containing protein [Parcubacteria group bacterium]|nr:DUF4340 domain-containing protein [Parcubacteria group bacterium]